MYVREIKNCFCRDWNYMHMHMVTRIGEFVLSSMSAWMVHEFILLSSKCVTRHSRTRANQSTHTSYTGTLLESKGNIEAFAIKCVSTALGGWRMRYGLCIRFWNRFSYQFIQFLVEWKKRNLKRTIRMEIEIHGIDLNHSHISAWIENLLLIEFNQFYWAM